MLLHIYVDRIHFEEPPNNTMAAFLTVHSGSFEYCVSSVYYKSGTAVFDQVVHIPIPNDNDTVTKVTLIGSIFLKNGLFEPEGKCSFITSPIEHGTPKKLSLFGKKGTVVSEVSLTASFYSAPIGTEEPKMGKNPEQMITDDFRKEYNFLMTRKKNWSGNRPSTWRGDHEMLLTDNGIDSNSPTRKRHSVALNTNKNANQKKCESPKLRKTCMAVGYVNFWPSFQNVESEEDKIMLKLHLAEQRRLKLLRDNEERVKAMNNADKKRSDKALQRKPDKDVQKLKKILNEKENELQQLRRHMASNTALNVHKDFHTYHHTHSAVHSNIQTYIMGPKKVKSNLVSKDVPRSVASGRNIAPTLKERQRKVVRKKKAVKSRKKCTVKPTDKENSEKDLTSSKTKRQSRIKSRRETLKSKSVDTSAHKFSGGSRLLKKILTKSEILKQRLNNSWKSDSASEAIQLKLSKMIDLSSASTDNSSPRSDGNNEPKDGFDDLNESMSELRQSFREALDLTAKKASKRESEWIDDERKGENQIKEYTKTVYIPTHSTLRLHVPPADTAAQHSTGIDDTDDQNQPHSSGHNSFINGNYFTTVPKSVGNDNYKPSLHEDILLEMGASPPSSDSDSIDLVRHSKLLGLSDNSSSVNYRSERGVTREKSSNSRTQKRSSVSKRPLSRERQRVMYASTASSRMKAAPQKAGQKVNKTSSLSSRKVKKDSKHGIDVSKNYHKNVVATTPRTKSSYLQLLLSNSKDTSEEIILDNLLYEADDVAVDFDYESTMAKLLAATPIVDSKTQSSQFSESDFAVDSNIAVLQDITADEKTEDTLQHPAQEDTDSPENVNIDSPEDMNPEQNNLDKNDISSESSTLLTGNAEQVLPPNTASNGQVDFSSQIINVPAAVNMLEVRY